MPTSISNVNNTLNLLESIQAKFDLSLPNFKDHQEIKYKFKTYQDFNYPDVIGIKINLTINFESTASSYKTNAILIPNQLIKAPLEYGDHFNNLMINEKSCTWNSAGALFYLTFDGKLSITSKQTITVQNILIRGIGELELAGKEFNNLKLKARNIRFADDFSAKNLSLITESIFNDKIVRVNLLNLIAKGVDNHGGMLIESNGMLKVDLFDNEAGEFFAIIKQI